MYKNMNKTKFLRKKIHVTAQDIKKGRKCNNFKCAISLALEREFNTSEAFVNKTSFGLYSNGILCDGDFPRSARRFINKFDKQKNLVKPFNFIVTYYDYR